MTVLNEILANPAAPCKQYRHIPLPGPKLYNPGIAANPGKFVGNSANGFRESKRHWGDRKFNFGAPLISLLSVILKHATCNPKPQTPNREP